MPIDVNSINLNCSGDDWFKPFEMECVKKPDNLTYNRALVYTLEIHPLLVMARSVDVISSNSLPADTVSTVYSDMFILMLDYLENGFIINNFKKPFNA
jgi:hypothetical protein